VAKTFLQVLQKQGIAFKLQSKVTKVSKTGSGASVTVCSQTPSEHMRARARTHARSGSVIPP
jgi:L-2-hydroxyglutarate oxidase LhgO